MYQDSFPPRPQVRVIPLELQRLFASLLLIDQQSASTADLTDSFGWNSSEVSEKEKWRLGLHRLIYLTLICKT